MNAVLLIPYYISWHYSRGFIDLIENLKNGIRFVFSWFSISSLLKTFFTPWRRLGDEYQGGFHPQEFFATMLVNTILRLLGMSVRFVVIVFGLIATLAMSVACIVICVCWIFFPVLIAFFLAIAVTKLA